MSRKSGEGKSILQIREELGGTRDLRRNPKSGTTIPTNDDDDEKSAPSTPSTPSNASVNGEQAANNQENAPDAGAVMVMNMMETKLRC